jgi:hypothetical protein
MVIENLEVRVKEVERRVIPFGAQYLEEPKIDSPGRPESWEWEPEVRIDLDPTIYASWSGTTATGINYTDERYSENQ